MMVRFSVEVGFRALIGAFLLSCTFLASSYNTTFAFDHPLTSAAFACFLSGTALLVLSRFIHYIPKISSSPSKYSVIPLTEPDQSPTEVLTPISFDTEPLTTRTRLPIRWVKVGIVSAIGCVRIAIYRRTTLNIECAPSGYAYLIPFLVAIYDFLRNQRTRPVQKPPASDRPSNVALRILVTLAHRSHFIIFQSSVRYIIAAAFLAASGFATSSLHTGSQSTYICSVVSGQHLRQQIFKILSVILDFLILVGAAELSGEGIRPQNGRKQTLLSWGFGLIGVSIFWAIIVVIWMARARENDFVTSHYLRSAAGQAALVTCVIVSASQLISFYGMVGLSMLAGFISIYFGWTTTLFNGQEPFPLIFPSYAFAALFSCYVGAMIFLHARTTADDEPQFLHKLNWFLRFTFSCMFGIGLIWVFNQPSVSQLHPIDLLVYEGQNNHQAWLTRAKASNSLEQAVENYRAKYKQHPPPGFDIWYNYAVNRSSVNIDEFDQIHTDLLPFRALPPHRIREMTRLIATNPYNDIGGIIIRNGSVHVQDDIKPTHRWMVLGAAEIIKRFSEHLPDMDLAFNLNDEPRVIVPWKKMSEYKHKAHAKPPPPAEILVDQWSANRADTWGPMEPANQTSQTIFADSSFKNIFDRYVSPACPPGSKARAQRIWDKRNLCVGCTRPHAMGQFPTDWNVATDICHQPDLAYLHGFFLSPASFKVTQELMPVFSQSAISGFNDIMFPSPWNYVDKVRYQPNEDYPDHDYLDKAKSLFWIGSTTEGLSHDGRWKGMPRQRLAHLVNNNTYNHVSVLLPHSESETYSYQILDPQAPSQTLGLQTSVRVADPIVRCWAEDCEDQKAELGGASRVDFQSHWQHRFLFDSDGAGFSGRFLPFLQSHSITFKTGLFRQWLDDRVIPWIHYVPIDLRLHGLWSTLAYFSGVDAKVGDQHIKMDPHDTRGRWIAEESRKWASTALRKEDMEIYFFRLLLEWGRLTDDQRDVLGYKP